MEVFKFLISFIIISVTAKDVEAGSTKTYLCPKDFLRIGFNCYYLSSKMVTWDDSFYECWQRGAMLADIDGPWEDRIIKAYLNRPQLTKLNRWIGGVSNWHQRKWVWGSSGFPIEYKGFSDNEEHPTTPWHCIYMDPTTGYEWKDAFCMERMHFICKTHQLKLIVEDPVNDV